jgi:hypothetical protein
VWFPDKTPKPSWDKSYTITLNGLVRCVDKISKSLPKEGNSDENYKEMLDKKAKSWVNLGLRR